MDVAEAVQIVCVAGDAVRTGVGLTVIVKVIGGPEHPLALAITLTVVVIGELVVFVAVNDGIFPVPRVPNPTLAVLVHA